MHGHSNDAIDLVLIIYAQIHVKSTISALDERILFLILQARHPVLRHFTDSIQS